jgi:hypothetical protein
LAAFVVDFVVEHLHSVGFVVAAVAADYLIAKY